MTTCWATPQTGGPYTFYQTYGKPRVRRHYLCGALAGIDQTLYEAAEIDGASRFQRIMRVTIPCILDTIMIMLILRIGQMLSVGYEKTILLYNPQVYETADILSSFIYRKGIQEMNYGYSTAVSLFNSVINFVLLIIANTISKKYTETGLF